MNALQPFIRQTPPGVCPCQKQGINYHTSRTPHFFIAPVFLSRHYYLQPFKPICYYAIKQRLPLLAPAKSRALTPLTTLQTIHLPNAPRAFAPARQDFPTSPTNPRFFYALFSFHKQPIQTIHPPNATRRLPPLCGAYQTRKNTTPLLTAGLPRSPHKCASLAVTKSDNIFPKTFIRQMRPRAHLPPPRGATPHSPQRKAYHNSYSQHPSLPVARPLPRPAGLLLQPPVRDTQPFLPVALPLQV